MGRVQEGIDTRNRLADALLDMCKHENPAKIKVIDLCRHAQVERQTFYHHFSDIYALAEFTYDREVTRLLEQENIWESIVEEDPREHSIHILKILEDSDTELKNLLFFYSSRNQHGHFFDLVQCNLMNGLMRALLEAEINRERASRIVKLQSIEISAVVVSWLRKDIDESAEDLVDYIMNTIDDIVEGEKRRLTAPKRKAGSVSCAKPA